MSDLPFRAQASASSGPGSSGDNSHIGRGGEDADINGTQGGAPGGRLPQDDLPMRSSPPSWSEGFSPTNDNPPLPSSHTDGVGLPPSGGRR
jgi:hypothetical protein